MMKIIPNKSPLLFMASGTTITTLKSAKRYINTFPSQHLNSVQAVLVQHCPETVVSPLMFKHFSDQTVDEHFQDSCRFLLAACKIFQRLSGVVIHSHERKVLLSTLFCST